VLAYSEMDDRIFTHLSTFSNLAVLRLDRTRVSGDGLQALRGLKNLKELGLSGAKVADSGVDHLLSLKGLKTLYVADTAISAAGLERLKKGLPTTELITAPPSNALPPRFKNSLNMEFALVPKGKAWLGGGGKEGTSNGGK